MFLKGARFANELRGKENLPGPGSYDPLLELKKPESIKVRPPI